MAQETQGFFQMLGAYFNQVKEQIKRSEFNLFQLVIAFGGGCLLGFIIKRYSNYVIALILFIAGLFLLAHANYLTISLNNSLIESTFGIRPVPLNVEGLSQLFYWAKLNAGLSISFVIGMVVGLKLA